MQTYEDTLKYLESLVNYEKTGPEEFKGKSFDLDKLRQALEVLGDPQLDYRSIHIAGTKGKGSISAFTSSVLSASGYCVGLFTSPHLTYPEERVSVNGRNISTEELAGIVEYIRECLPGSGKDLTFFEMYTLIAMVYFSEKKADYAVFETGMGGRFDATNVLDEKVCGISPISYDHMQVLGNKLEQIAAEKAAIIKEGNCCVCAPQNETVLDVVRSRCSEKGVSLSLVGEDITYRVKSVDTGGSTFDLRSETHEYNGCQTGLLGEFQVANCAVAVGICEKLLDDKVNVDDFKKGIKEAFIPGRMEVLSREPMVMIDGAQNGASARQLKESVEQIFRYDKLILLLGLSRDKDIKSVCDELVPLADEVVLTRAGVDRALNPELIRGYIKGREVKLTRDVTEALGTAFHLAGKNDLILATGSFFVIGEVRDLVIKK
ncbi:MAG: folylpolyglutamate synthase/dihydrofolate synthase family protein [Candidatus Omnitrophota bacterium]